MNQLRSMEQVQRFNFSHVGEGQGVQVESDLFLSMRDKSHTSNTRRYIVARR